MSMFNGIMESVNNMFPPDSEFPDPEGRAKCILNMMCGYLKIEIKYSSDDPKTAKLLQDIMDMIEEAQKPLMYFRRVHDSLEKEDKYANDPV